MVFSSLYSGDKIESQTQKISSVWYVLTDKIKLIFPCMSFSLLNHVYVEYIRNKRAKNPLCSSSAHRRLCKCPISDNKAKTSGAPNENILQNHLIKHCIVKRILVFKR